MTPGARLAAAIGVLEVWLAGTPAEKALTHWARGARYAGSRDRAAVRDHVYDVLRQRNSCAMAGGGDTGRALVLGLLRLQGQDPAALFTGGYAPDPLAQGEGRGALPPPDPWRDIPQWLHARLQADLKDQAAGIMARMGQRAPLFLRVNLRKTGMEKVQERLAKDGIKTEKTDLPSALIVTDGARRLRQSGAYLDGWVEPQDLSVQQAVASVTWPEKGHILDYCAGGGGKALAVAARTAAVIHVHDANPARMRDIPTRAGRAGVTLPAMRDRQRYDVVLTDVPCSGSGTWRRDPEAKWSLTPERLDTLLKTQMNILEEAARKVADGGRIIYMTCSFLRAENEDRLAAFCARHPEWCVTAETRFTPFGGSDGFFVAELSQS